MARKNPATVPYRRVREHRTNYLKRMKLLFSPKPRLIVRLTNTKVIGQVVAFTPGGDKIVTAGDSGILRKYGWTYSLKSVPAAYLMGYYLGRKTLARGHREAVFDTGLRNPLNHGRQYAFLNGLLDAGVLVPHGEGIFPDQDRQQGAHIQHFITSSPVRGAQFAQYLKKQGRPVPELFVEVKQKIKEAAW